MFVLPVIVSRRWDVSFCVRPVKCDVLSESNRDNREEAAVPRLLSVADKLLWFGLAQWTQNTAHNKQERF